MSYSAVVKAQREIAAILARLETETGCVVRFVELRDTDTTKFGVGPRRRSRVVEVHLERRPGSDWLT